MPTPAIASRTSGVFDHARDRADAVRRAARQVGRLLGRPGGRRQPADAPPGIGFVAPSRPEVDEFWRVGTAAGHPDDGAPGARPQYRPDCYGAFLLDPDGNSVEAVHHG